MRNLIFILCIIIFSCNTEDGIEHSLPNDEPCEALNPIGLIVRPLDKSAELIFGEIGILDGFIKICSPEAFEIFISEDGDQFDQLDRLEGPGGSYIVDNLQNDSTYFFKVNALHSDLDPLESGDIHKSEEYWISNFNYSLDGLSVYFKSNKNNVSSSLFEKKVFQNIWKLNLSTLEIEQITDFLPDNFEMRTAVEDPNLPGNFYVLGGIQGAVVEIEGAFLIPIKWMFITIMQWINHSI